MIKKALNNHKTIITNTLYLSIIQCVRLLTPFLAMPYVIKTIGAEKFGEIVFAQSIAAFSFIIINFGLDVSAVKDISQNRDDKQELSKIVSSVLSVKALLFILTAIIYAIIVFTVPQFRDNYILFFIVFSSAITEVLFPAWYYQGVEKMGLITITSTLSIIFYVSMLFIVVSDSSDYLYVPMLQVGGQIFSAILGFSMLLRFEKIKLSLPRKQVMIKTFKDSVPFFTSRISVVVNNNIAKILSGLFLGMTEVAAFELAQKIIGAALIPFSMLNQAIFPHNARQQNRVFAKKILYITLCLAVIGAACVYVLAPVVVELFAGKGMLLESIQILRILAIYLMAGTMALYLGSPTLVAWGYYKPFNRSVYLSTTILLVVYAVLYIANALSLESFAVALILSELAIATYRYYYCVKLKIF